MIEQPHLLAHQDSMQAADEPKEGTLLPVDELKKAD